MKIAILVLSIFVIGMNSAMADDIADVKKDEIELWEAWHNQDVKKWSELTSPEYVWSDGRQIRGYSAVEKEFGMGKLAQYKTSDMQAVRISADVIVLSYRASINGVYNGKPFQSDVAECSVWTKSGGKWRNVMLQEVETSGKETQVTPP